MPNLKNRKLLDNNKQITRDEKTLGLDQTGKKKKEEDKERIFFLLFSFSLWRPNELPILDPLPPLSSCLFGAKVCSNRITWSALVLFPLRLRIRGRPPKLGTKMVFTALPLFPVFCLPLN